MSSASQKSDENIPAEAYRHRLRRSIVWLTLGLATVPILRRGLRRILHGVMRGLVRLRSEDLAIDQAGPILILAPHPDDETLGCGGLICLERRRGTAVHVAFVTDGSGSHPNHPLVKPAELAARRQREALAALSILGVESSAVDFLAARDGTLAQLESAAQAGLTEQISDLISRVQPRTILLPCRRDGSSEHDAAFQIAMDALSGAAVRPRILEFPVWSWWNPLLLLSPLRRSRKIWRRRLQGAEQAKRRAIAEYVTQVQPMPPTAEAVLSHEFLSYFHSPEEYFFER